MRVGLAMRLVTPSWTELGLSHHFKGGMPHFTHAAAAVVSQSKVVQAPCLTLVGSLNQP